MRARIARKNLNEQIKMYTAFIEGEGQVNSDMKMEYAGFLLFMAGRELRKLKGKQKRLAEIVLLNWWVRTWSSYIEFANRRHNG